ncbi:hypothetical protein EGW08_002553, partial [Elysia chlorotica]
GPHPASGAEVLKLCNFYTGVTLSLCGVGAFFVGATSRKWVEVEGVGFGYPHKSLAHMGPWLACTKDNHCDRPWVLAPGIAVMALVFILMMGELKRKLILHFDQTSRPGWAFVVCLTSVLATVAGSVCITFNR